MRPKHKYRCDDCWRESHHDPREFERPQPVKCPNCGGVHLTDTGEAQVVVNKKTFRRWVDV